jgi:hypothetical protein
MTPPFTPMQKLRIVTLGISGARSLTGPLRDDRRFPSTRWYPVPGATRTTLEFVHHSRTIILCRGVPNLSVTIRNFFIAVRHCVHSRGRLTMNRCGSCRYSSCHRNWLADADQCGGVGGIS